MSDQSISFSQLESHLWEAANILRGPVDAPADARLLRRAVRRRGLQPHDADQDHGAQGRHATQHQLLDCVHPRTAPGLSTLAGRDRQARRRLPLTVQRH